MKRSFILLAAAILAASVSVSAQDTSSALKQAAEALENAPDKKEKPERPNYWTDKATFDFGITNTFLSNWAAGGFNTFALNTGLDASAIYKKDLMSWENRLQLQYGFQITDERKGIIQKTNDRMYLQSKWGYRTSHDSKWNYTASYDFLSQFNESYKYGNPLKEDAKKPEDYNRTLQSSFFSPAYLNVGLGLQWVPSKWFDINIAPLTGGVTICKDDRLRKKYGMELVDPDDPDVYKDVRFQFGAQIKTNLKFSINEVFNYETQLVLFSDYLYKPLNLRVNWDTKITWQLNKLFKIAVNTWMLYDPNVCIPDEAHPDGIRRVQWKEYLAFNITYTIGTKK